MPPKKDKKAEDTKSNKGGAKDNKSEKGGPSPEKKEKRPKSIAKNGSKNIDSTSVMEKQTEKGDATPDQPIKKQPSKSVEK